MGETVEKIYCCDRDNNDNALAAAILANGNNRRDDCKCQAETQVINERFVVAFQGRTTLPTSVTINQLGMTQGLIKIVCGKSNCYAINSSLSVSIPAEPAT